MFKAFHEPYDVPPYISAANPNTYEQCDMSAGAAADSADKGAIPANTKLGTMIAWMQFSSVGKQ